MQAGQVAQGVRSLAVLSNQARSLLNFRGPLIQALAEQGITVYALAPDFDEELRSRIVAHGAKPIDYSLARTGMNPLRDLFDTIRLRRLLRQLSPDTSLAYFIKPVIYGSIAAWAAGVPRRFSMIEGVGYVFMGAEASASRRFLRAMVSRLYKVALSLNRKVFFLNPDDSSLFVKTGLVEERQVVRIDGIGLDLDHFAPAAPVLDPVTFLFVGRMLREKGVYEFVDAARRLRRSCARTRFVLVGGGDANPGSIAESQIQSWVDEGLVEWAGQVEDVRPWISRASVFVLPSYREGLPRSTQEAMAMARPVITTDAVGCRETVEDGINGWRVPVGDVDALARAMRRFIESPDLVATMGRESRRLAERRFDVRVINRQIMGVLDT